MLAKTLAFLAAASVSATFFIDLCGAVFQCGCVSLWRGAAQHCNIHTAGVPHCPWCAGGIPGEALALALILAPQALACFGPFAWSWPRRLLAALALFPLAGIAAALAFGLATGYWR